MEVLWIINNIYAAIIRKKKKKQADSPVRHICSSFSYAQAQPYPQYPDRYNSIPQQSGPVTTTQVTIPTELAGK